MSDIRILDWQSRGRGFESHLLQWRVANPNGDINIFSGLYIKRNGNIGLDD